MFLHLFFIYDLQMRTIEAVKLSIGQQYASATVWPSPV